MPTTRTFIAGLAGAATALLFSAATAIGQAWNYDDPSKWREIKGYEACGQSIQSPITLGNVTRNAPTRGSRPAAGSPFVSYAIPVKAKNDGHTVELEAPKDEKNFIEPNRLVPVCGPGAWYHCAKYARTGYIDAGPAYRNQGPFYLEQLHFHAPSEHTSKHPLADSQGRFPLEAHFVHQSRAKPNIPARLAVLAVMFVAGKENAALKALPETLTATASGSGNIDLTQLIPPVGDNGYLPAGYYYWGSKTTPPCTGGVFWYVARDPVEASQDQINRLATVLKTNNRPIQPRGGRQIRFSD